MILKNERIMTIPSDNIHASDKCMHKLPYLPKDGGQVA
jgi:hypothetical protein